MNEENLREAMHDVIVRSTPPTSMDPAHALDRARQAGRRRRAAQTGAAVVTLMVGLGAGPTLVTSLGERSAGDMVAGGGSTIAPTTTRKSGDPWPEGQTDRTASTGPRADRAAELLDDLGALLPPGFDSVDMTDAAGRPVRWSQAQYASADGEPDYWEYSALIPVMKDNHAGRLMVLSTTPSGKPPVAPCTLAKRFPSTTAPGTCTTITVNGATVAVITTTTRSTWDQWAAFRHPDGTITYVAQTKQTPKSLYPSLTHQVFTPQELAALATSRILTP